MVNIADYAKVTLDHCDSWGNPIEIPFEDVELIKDASNTTDWQQVRIQAAIAAMQGILASKTMMEIIDETVRIGVLNGKEVSADSAAAKISVGFADELIKELKGE